MRVVDCLPVRHHHIRPGPAFLHQRHVIAADVPHHEVIGRTLVLAGGKVRGVAISAGQLPKGPVLDTGDGLPVPDGERGVHIGCVPAHVRADTAHAGELLRVVGAVHMVLDVQRQPGPGGQTLLQLLRVAEAVVHFLRVQTGRLPAGYLRAVVRVDRGLGDVAARHMQIPVLVHAAGRGAAVEANVSVHTEPFIAKNPRFPPNNFAAFYGNLAFRHPGLIFPVAYQNGFFRLPFDGQRRSQDIMVWFQDTFYAFTLRFFFNNTHG